MASSMKILGIDPGTNLTGYAIIEAAGSNYSLITTGTFDLRKLDNHQTKLKEIFLQLQDLVESFLPKHLAIEAPFYGKNVQSMLKLGRAQGVAMAAGMTMGLEIFEYSPKKIKLAITGNGNASKEQVCAMLEQRLKINLDKKNLDASDALGAAICHAQQLSNPVVVKAQSFSGWKGFIKQNPDRIKKA